MAQGLPIAAGIKPEARLATNHTLHRQRTAFFTRGLPGRRRDGPHRADPRRLLRQGRRDRAGCGRRIPYAQAATGSPSALVAGVVRPPMRGLLVAPLGGPTPLAPRRFATAARPVAVATVAAAADGERPLAAPAPAGVKEGNTHRRPPAPRLWTPAPACARLLSCGCSCPVFWRAAEQPESPRRPPGVFSSTALATGSLTSSPSSGPLALPPPRYARDDAAWMARPRGSDFYGFR